MQDDSIPIPFVTSASYLTVDSYDKYKRQMQRQNNQASHLFAAVLEQSASKAEDDGTLD